MASGKTLLERAGRIGLRRCEIARAAGLHAQTVKNIGLDRKRGAGTVTLAKVEEVIAKKEIELLDDLLPLHLEARAERIAELLSHKGFRIEREAA